MFSFGGMKTKVTILGESTVEQPKKKIEFIHCITGDGKLADPVLPEDYNNIMLLKKNYNNTGLDLMYAYDNISYGWAYLGKFNEGIV